MVKIIYWYEYWLQKAAKNDLKKNFYKVMNNSIFGKTMGNLQKDRDFELVTTKRRKKYLVSEPNYQTTKFFTGIY